MSNSTFNSIGSDRVGIDAIVAVQSAWQTVDLSAYVPVGATAAIIEFHQTGTSTAGLSGVRHPSCSIETASYQYSTSNLFLLAPLDSSRQTSFRRTSSSIHVYIHGWTMDGVTMLVNRVWLGTHVGSGTWDTMDLSGSIPAGAKAAIFEIFSTYPNPTTGSFRHPDSNVNFPSPNSSVTRYHGFNISSINSARQVAWGAAAGATGQYLVGYITGSDFYAPVEIVSVTPTVAGSEQTKNLSYYVPKGAEMVLIHAYGPGTWSTLRKDSGYTSQYAHTSAYVTSPTALTTDRTYLGTIANVQSYYHAYVGWAASLPYANIWTQAATSVSAFEAVLNGLIQSSDLSDIDEYGFDYGYASGSYTLESTVSGSPSSTSFSATLELNSATFYFFRAKIHSVTHGWIYGSELYFQTSADPNTIQYENFVSAGGTYNRIAGTWWSYQSFTPSIGHLVRELKLEIYRVGSPGTLNVEIYATDGSGNPTGTALLSVEFPGNLLSTSATWYNIGLRDGVVLQPATKYAIVLSAPSGTINTHDVRWVARGTGGYAGGVYGYSTDSGSSWTQNASADFNFEELGYSGVETYPPTNISHFVATGKGYILDTTDITEIGFEWGEDDGGPYPYDVTVTSGSFDPGYYQNTLSGLTYDTTYYYRAKVWNDSGGYWLYGNQVTFVTPAAHPLVTTDNPNTIGETSIVAQETITSIGAEIADIRGFVYSLTSHSDPGNVAPASSGYELSVSSSGSFDVGTYLSVLPTTANKKYYIRAFAHNSYGYSYGTEIFVYTGATVNILYPIGDYSTGIRFSTNPDVPHWWLTHNDDSVLVYPYGIWGYLSGNFVYERNYYNGNMYTDLYSMSNPSRRTEGIVKIKWKGKVLRTAYPYGHYQRQLMTHGVQYSGTKLDIPAGNDNAWRCEIFYTNPYTGDAWTLSEVDGIVAGISVGESGGFGIAACDAVWVYVLWANASARTNPSNYLTETSYRLNGYVTEDEGETCDVWFQWGTTSGFGNVTTSEEKAKGQSFSADITASGEIFFRTVIETACGETFYGDTRTTTQQPMTLPLRGFFVRGDEIQVTFSVSGYSRPYRSPDFGATWYPCAGLDNVDTGDVGFDSRDEQNSFFGGSGHLYVVDSVSGETFTYIEGATISGVVDQVDVDMDLPISLIATREKLYKSVDWGETVLEMLNEPIIDVAFGGVGLAPEPQLELMTPTGDGDYRQLSPYPSTPTTHYDKVIEASDSKKCSNSLGGYGGSGDWGYNGRLADTYFFTNLVGTGTIASITVHATVGVASALMSRNFIVRVSGVNYFSGYSSVGGGDISYTWNTNPATGQPWTKAELQNGTFQAGIIISDTGVPSGCWLDKIWIEVTWD